MEPAVGRTPGLFGRVGTTEIGAPFFAGPGRFCGQLREGNTHFKQILRLGIICAGFNSGVPVRVSENTPILQFGTHPAVINVTQGRDDELGIVRAGFSRIDEDFKNYNLKNYPFCPIVAEDVQI